MKTIVVHLEASDNQISICEKMEMSKAKRYLLVWPRRARLVENEIDVNLIKRKAQQLGGQVAIVSRNPKVIGNAEKEGIPVFPSVPRAEKSHWKNSFSLYEKVENINRVNQIREYQRNRKKKKPQNLFSTSGRILSVGLSALAIIMLAGFLIPSAQVILYPTVEEKNITIDIWASPEVHEINPNGNLPAKIEQIEVTGSIDGVSSGTTNLASAFATGEVVFQNQTINTVNIPAGTILSTAGDTIIQFETTSPITIEPGANNLVVAPIKALIAGSSGNVAAGQITQIEGDLGSLLKARNESDLSGGADQDAPSPTEEDYSKLKTRLLSDLKDKASSQINSENQKIIPESIDKGTVILETRSIEPGQPGQNITLTMTVKFTGLSYGVKELNLLVRKVVDSNLGSNQILYLEQMSSEIQDVQINNNSAKWQESVQISVIPRVDDLEIATEISGKDVEKAIEILNSKVDSRQPADIRVRNIINRIPFAAFRIHFQVK
jgi:hypothetical protein